MQELQTNRPNFFFKKRQDFNQTNYVEPQEPIVFIDNINLYFNCLGFMQDVFKGPCNGTSWGVSELRFFLSNAALFMHFLFHYSLPTGQRATIFGIQNCKYCLPISNPYIILKLIVCQNVVHYLEEMLHKGH